MTKVIFLISLLIFIMPNSHAQSGDTLQCPELRITGPNKGVIIEGKSATFTLAMQKKFENSGLTYNWAVNNGTIVNGQGTKAITVDTKELAGQLIIASVEISGLPVTCDNIKSLIIEVIK